MSHILYLDNQYVNSLETLRDLIVRAVKDESPLLYKEVETLFKDKVIHKWLEIGDEECHKILSSLILIPDNIDSSKLKEKIGNIFSNEQIKVTRNYRDFIQLNNAYYSIDNKQYESFTDSIEFSTENDVSCTIKMYFKVLKQDSESFQVDLLLDNVNVSESQNIDIRQYLDGETAEIIFPYIHIKQGFQRGVFSVKIDNDEIKQIKFNGEYERKFEVTAKDGSKVEFTMIKIKGGSFNMSTDYLVELSDYYLGQFPVTQELWEAIMNSNPSRFVDKFNPVENVSWDDICKQHGFLYKLNKQMKDVMPTGWKFVLPTEAQWEYAARWGKKRKNNKFAGATMEALLHFYCWFDKNSQHTTHQVGTKKPNELDLYDMSGNVWEWCYDFYNNFPQGKKINPKGPKTGYTHVERGGSYYHSASDCQLNVRRCWEPWRSDDTLGFRLCMIKI